MSTPHVHDGPRSLGPLLRIPANAITRRLYAGLSTSFPDLRQSHLVVFQHIDHPPDGTRLTVLADRGQVSKQSLIELVDDLERLGYVERTADPADRRAKLIRLTARGWRVHERAFELFGPIRQEWERLLGKDDLDRLAEILSRLVDAIEAEPRHG